MTTGRWRRRWTTGRLGRAVSAAVVRSALEVPNRVSSVSHAITGEELSVSPVSARASPGGVDACLHTKHIPATISARVMIEDSITVTVVCHGGRGLEGQQKKGGENLDVHHDEEVIIMKAPWMVSEILR